MAEPFLALKELVAALTTSRAPGNGSISRRITIMHLPCGGKPRSNHVR